MKARVPQDVDLEDRLLFGLTAVRFGELAFACVCAAVAWHAIPFLGGPVAVVLLAGGAAAAWTSWRGRGADHWVVASTRFVLRTWRIEHVSRHPDAARLRRSRARRSTRSLLRVLDGSLE